MFLTRRALGWIFLDLILIIFIAVIAAMCLFCLCTEDIIQLEEIAECLALQRMISRCVRLSKLINRFSQKRKSRIIGGQQLPNINIPARCSLYSMMKGLSSKSPSSCCCFHMLQLSIQSYCETESTSTWD